MMSSHPPDREGKRSRSKKRGSPPTDNSGQLTGNLAGKKKVEKKATTKRWGSKAQLLRGHEETKRKNKSPEKSLQKKPKKSEGTEFMLRKKQLTKNTVHNSLPT